MGQNSNSKVTIGLKIQPPLAGYCTFRTRKEKHINSFIIYFQWLFLSHKLVLYVARIDTNIMIVLNPEIGKFSPPRRVFNMLGVAVKTKKLPLINFRDASPSLCLPPYVTFAHRSTQSHCLVARAAAHCKHKPYCNYSMLLNTELLPGREKLPLPGSSKTSLTPFLRVSFSVTATRRSCCCCCQSEGK